MKVFDPYDIWSSSALGRIKQGWYDGNVLAGIFLRLVALFDCSMPVLLRNALKTDKHFFPHVEALGVLSLLDKSNSGYKQRVLSKLRSSVTTSGGWGLPFVWYSKNGRYDSNTPYVTNTPYVMEALLELAKDYSVREDAMIMFNSTWGFLESLKVIIDTDDVLALSYAPVDEPRIVVNANSYAAFSYALHAMKGRKKVESIAHEKVLRLTRYVVCQQNADGSWPYYADQEAGNFIDGFHSCFVVKNLLKVGGLLPDCKQLVNCAVDKGWLFIQNNLFDSAKGLCRRFVKRSHRDLFKWDLYDQAEYLGLLVDFGLLEEASCFSERVERLFRKDIHWYCRIDVFGRRWGRDFLRWGIAPFQYHQARLRQALEARL